MNPGHRCRVPIAPVQSSRPHWSVSPQMATGRCPSSDGLVRGGSLDLGTPDRRRLKTGGRPLQPPNAWLRNAMNAACPRRTGATQVGLIRRAGDLLLPPDPTFALPGPRAVQVGTVVRYRAQIRRALVGRGERTDLSRRGLLRGGGGGATVRHAHPSGLPSSPGDQAQVGRRCLEVG
jgi:hypothetical protein